MCTRVCVYARVCVCVCVVSSANPREGQEDVFREGEGISPQGKRERVSKREEGAIERKRIKKARWGKGKRACTRAGNAHREGGQMGREGGGGGAGEGGEQSRRRGEKRTSSRERLLVYIWF